MVYVIGRLDDLERREARPGEQQLGHVLARWSFDGNADWLGDGARRNEPFLQVSLAAPGSVLQWELERLQALGYLAVGPWWVPAAWFRDAASYRRVLTRIADHVLALPRTGEAIYVPKARAEFELLLALWPHVLALPTATALSIDELILGRAWPVHPLGVVAGTAWADGRVCDPAEFFCHDLDHARFKIREDLLARGVPIVDPYQHGSTFDQERGAHRTVLDLAAAFVDGDGWRRGAQRQARARAWLAAIAAEPRRSLADAARWLLFEMVHEKSLPLEPSVLGPALASRVHTDKLLAKSAHGFFGRHAPSPAALASLEAARVWLASVIAEIPS